MSKTGTEQVKSDVQQQEIARKQLFYQRISAVCMIVMALCVLFAVLKIVPQVETTLSHINDTRRIKGRQI